jgi:hypothetical protein
MPGYPPLLGKEFFQLRPVLGALPDHPGPARGIGFVEIFFRIRGREGDRLDPGLGLPLGIGGILFGELGRRLRLAFGGGLGQHCFLLIVELVPNALVDQD